MTSSYEVSLIIIFLMLIILREKYSFLDFMKWQVYTYMLWVIVKSIIFGIFVRVLVELNRRPIDFVEGESELVSGFNVEHFREVFALIFIV